MNYGTATRFSPQEVLEMGERYFGPAGLGLQVEAREAARLQLAGPCGKVSLRVQATGSATEAFLTSEGLDDAVCHFMVEVYEAAHPQQGESSPSHTPLTNARRRRESDV